MAVIYRCPNYELKSNWWWIYILKSILGWLQGREFRMQLVLRELDELRLQQLVYKLNKLCAGIKHACMN